MDEKNINTTTTEEPEITSKLEDAIKEKIEQVGRQNMLLGAQSMCKVILEKIFVAKKKPGKFTYRDYERLVNDIEDFCVTGLSRKVELDGTTNDNTEEV